MNKLEDFNFDKNAAAIIQRSRRIYANLCNLSDKLQLSRGET